MSLGAVDGRPRTWRVTDSTVSAASLCNSRHVTDRTVSAASLCNSRRVTRGVRTAFEQPMNVQLKPYGGIGDWQVMLPAPVTSGTQALLARVQVTTADAHIQLRVPGSLATSCRGFVVACAAMHATVVVWWRPPQKPVASGALRCTNAQMEFAQMM